MKLCIKRFTVKDIVFANTSAFIGEVLHVNKEELESAALADLKKYKIDFKIAKPGENVRIIHIMDTVKPAYKPSGSAFPGWLPGGKTSGEGITHQLEGISVMQTCTYPDIQEGVLDMFGEGSKYSIFSKTINVVMTISILEEVGKPDFAFDAKLMILRAAEYLAKITQNSNDFKEDFYEIKPDCQGLKKAGYAYYIQAQGPLRNTHIYAENCTKMKPRFLHPNEVLDGAIVSGNYIIACQKNPTYIHQDNPIIKELYKRDGESLQFGGVIVSTESSLLEGKKENAEKIAQIASEHGFDGIIVTQEGGGHADVDLMLALEECEKLGIKAVIATNEIAGPEGDLPPLVSYSNLADAIVTNGNNDEIVKLGKPDSVIGGDSVLNGKFDPYNSFSTSLGILYTSTNQLGSNCMTTIPY